MLDKPWHKNNATWQAYHYMKVNEECLREGKYPNGRKLKPKDEAECQMQIDNCKDVLNHYGINIEEPAVATQLKLF